MTSVAAPARSTSRSPYIIGGVLVVALLIIALIAGDGSSSTNGAPLSPTSTSADGTRALVELLGELGADERVGQRVPDSDTRVALLLNDGLDSTGRAELTSWVEAGGTLVVADPDSDLAAGSRGGFGGKIVQARCDMPALQDVRELTVPFAATFPVTSGRQSCFGDGRDAFIVRSSRGSGAIVSIGSAQMFVNSELGQLDNSILAARLLVPGEGASVAILDPNPPGSGHTTLGDLIADRVFQAMVQLVVAFALYALWRSRRLGRPVIESQPVAIAGSQFVRAVGGLQQRSRSTDRAAATLRADTRRALSERFGVAPTTDVSALAQLVDSRTGLDHAEIAAALADTPILDEQALVHLGQQLDIIRQEALDGRSH